MSDPILLPQSLPEKEIPDEPLHTESRPYTPTLWPLALLIPLVLRGIKSNGINTADTDYPIEERGPLLRFPKLFKTNDFLDILGAIEPHFNGYRQEFVNALMGVMDVHSSVKSLRQNWAGHGQSTAEAPARTGPDPISIFRSLVPYMTDDLRNPTERYINIIGSAQGLMRQWRDAGGLFPNAQSADGANPLMQILSTLVPGSQGIAQAMNLYQTMQASGAAKTGAPGHDEGTLRQEKRDTRGSLVRLVELAKEMGGGRGGSPGPADLAGLLSRLKTT